MIRVQNSEYLEYVHSSHALGVGLDIRLNLESKTRVVAHTVWIRAPGCTESLTSAVTVFSLQG